jgi:myo-inositol-1(or 4)-monophosphatase
VLEGAGGMLTNWRGETAYDGGQVIAAGDARAHADALVALKRAAR